MSQVSGNNLNQILTDPAYLRVLENLSNELKTSFGAEIPPAILQQLALDVFLPMLTAPKTSPNTEVGFSSKIGGLSVETLLEALGFQDRKLAAKQGIDTIDARGKERKEINDKQLQELKENLEKSPARKILDGFLKAFKIIGMVFAAIASVVTIAIGVATMNPALAIGGAILLGLAISSIANVATDGKAGFAQGIAKIAELCGASPEVAKWIGFGVEMALTAVAVVLTLGGAAAVAGAQAVAAQTGNAVSRTMNIANYIAKGSAAASGLAQVGSGASTIAAAVMDKEVEDRKAFMKELDAILQRMQMANEVDLDFLKELMTRNEELMQGTSDLVALNQEANTAVATGSPAMA